MSGLKLGTVSEAALPQDPGVRGVVCVYTSCKERTLSQATQQGNGGHDAVSAPLLLAVRTGAVLSAPPPQTHRVAATTFVSAASNLHQPGEITNY